MRRSKTDRSQHSQQHAYNLRCRAEDLGTAPHEKLDDYSMLVDSNCVAQMNMQSFHPSTGDLPLGATTLFKQRFALPRKYAPPSAFPLSFCAADKQDLVTVYCGNATKDYGDQAARESTVRGYLSCSLLRCSNSSLDPWVLLVTRGAEVFVPGAPIGKPVTNLETPTHVAGEAAYPFNEMVDSHGLSTALIYSRSSAVTLLARDFASSSLSPTSVPAVSSMDDGVHRVAVHTLEDKQGKIKPFRVRMANCSWLKHVQYYCWLLLLFVPLVTGLLGSFFRSPPHSLVMPPNVMPHLPGIVFYRHLSVRRMASEKNNFEQQLADLSIELRQISRRINDVEAEIDITDDSDRRSYLSLKLDRLHADKQAIREKEQAIREKEQTLLNLLLLDRTAAARVALYDRRKAIDMIIDFVGNTTDFSTHQYSADKGGHIVREAFKYCNRTVEEKQVVASFHNRQIKRNRGVFISEDKIDNPMTSVCGGPGIGKSTFMVHFPESAAYQRYLNEKGCTRCIVSTMTFNSGMSFGSPSLALRMLYGAIAAMSISPSERRNGKSWKDFSKAFVTKFTILPDCLEVVEILHELYNHSQSKSNCSFLFAVDEISKADDDAKCMRSIGGMLDHEKFELDIVVSSLSPMYVQDLVTGSQRAVDYNIIAPLLDEELGKEEVRAAVKTYCDLIKSSFRRNILNNLHMLTSGHPRSLETLLSYLQGKDGKEVLEEQAERRAGTTAGFILRISMGLAGVTELDRPLSLEILENIVLSPNPSTLDDLLFRKSLEEGSILALRNDKDLKTFDGTAQLWFFLKGLNDLRSKDISGYSRVAAAIKLFGEKGYTDPGNAQNDIADWWERAVALTIACRVQEGCDLSESLGCGREVDGGMALQCSTGSLRLNLYLDIGQFRSVISSDNELRMAPPNFPGVDGSLRVTNSAGALLQIYLQMKIYLNPEKDPSSIVAKSIFDTMLAMPSPRKNSMPPIFVFYMWGKEKPKVTKADVLKALKSINKAKGAARCVQYIHEYFDSNVRLVSGEQLEKWLLPTMRVIPRLVEAVEEKNSEGGYVQNEKMAE